MNLKQNNLQLQNDTVSVKDEIKIDLPKTVDTVGLHVKRNTIEIVEIREFTIDSSRLVKPKKTIPIKKTIPQVLVNDTIDIPVYNVVDNNFILPEGESFFDKLNFTPYNPASKLKIVSVDSSSVVKTKRKETITKEIIKEEFISYKNQRKAIGFVSTDWMLFVIIFSLIIFSWLRVGYNRFFRTSIQASYNYFSARRMIEEVNVARTRVYFFMDFLFYINMALFISQFLSYYHINIYNIHGILLFALLFVAILVLYFLKSILFRFFGFVLLSQNLFYAYNFTIFLYNRMIGIILLPIVAIVPYVSDSVAVWLFYIGFSSIIIIYILRIFRYLQISFRNRLSIFYLILYLCTVEILPMLVIYKIISLYI
jgi:hypothetical protein